MSLTEIYDLQTILLHPKSHSAKNIPNAVFDRKNPGFRIQDSEYNGKDILVLSAAMTQRDDFFAPKQLVFLEVVTE